MFSFPITSSDIQSPSVAAVNLSSISLHWNESAPKLTGNPHRDITQYAVTISSRDGGDSQNVLVPAEAGVVVNVTGVRLPNIFDIGIEVVIDTEGQGEQTYDIGVPVITVTPAAPGKYNNSKLGFVLLCHFYLGP